MKRCVIWLMNHVATSDQIEDLKSNCYSEIEFIEPTDEGKKMWAQVPADAGLKEIETLAVNVSRTLTGLPTHLNAGQDAVIAVVQGEPTLVTVMVQLLQRCHIPCFAATTKRESVETVNPDGTTTKTNVFKHVRFREYPDIAATYVGLAKSPIEAENPFLKD